MWRPKGVDRWLGYERPCDSTFILESHACLSSNQPTVDRCLSVFLCLALSFPLRETGRQRLALRARTTIPCVVKVFVFLLSCLFHLHDTWSRNVSDGLTTKSYSWKLSGSHRRHILWTNLSCYENMSMASNFQEIWLLMTVPRLRRGNVPGRSCTARKISRDDFVEVHERKEGVVDVEKKTTSTATHGRTPSFPSRNMLTVIRKRFNEKASRRLVSDHRLSFGVVTHDRLRLLINLFHDRPSLTFRGFQSH